MFDTILKTHRASNNIVALASILQDYPQAFQKIILEALTSEGFGLEDAGPNLQHPADILGAVSGSGLPQGHDSWETFRNALEEANHLGILVDVQTEPFPSEGSKT